MMKLILASLVLIALCAHVSAVDTWTSFPSRKIQSTTVCQNAQGAICPASCFDATATKVQNTDGSYTVSVKNCLIPSGGSPVSFITVSDCNSACGAQQVNVAGGATIATITIPKGSCSLNLCIYVHDGRWRTQTPPPVPTGSQSNCISSPQQVCQLCKYTVKITLNDGTTCDDGDACTQTDTCNAGVCTGSNPITCSSIDQCHVPGTCNPSTGVCSTPTAVEDTPCNDGNACTQTDTCKAGVCTGSNPKTCSSFDQCHVAGICNPSTGSCSDRTATDGTACSDGNAATCDDVCTSGVCAGSLCPGCSPTCDNVDDGTQGSCCNGQLCCNGFCTAPISGVCYDAACKAFSNSITYRCVKSCSSSGTVGHCDSAGGNKCNSYGVCCGADPQGTAVTTVKEVCSQCINDKLNLDYCGDLLGS